MRKLYTICISGLICTGMISCSGKKQEKEFVQTVKIDTIVSGNGQTILQYPGKVKSAEDANLSFKVSGTLRKIHAKDGARVRKGQLLAELDPIDYQVQLDATEAEYEQIKREAERVMALYKEGGTTANANDKATYGLKQITAKYNHHKDQLAYTRMYAPFDGVIQKHLFEEHETTGAGMPVMVLIGNDRPEIEINLPAAEYIRREQFQDYSCTFDIFPGQKYPLELLYITPNANANQLYTMRLKMAETQQTYPSPGMNTMVTIHCDTQSSDIMQLPASAILHQDGKTYVWHYQASSQTVHKREVTVVQLQTDGTALIQSKNVRPGEPVVSSGIHHVREGENVKPLPAITHTNIGGML